MQKGVVDKELVGRGKKLILPAGDSFKEFDIYFMKGVLWAGGWS